MKNKKCSIQIKGIAAFLVMVFVTTTVFPGNLRAAAAIPETVAFKDLGLSGLRISRSFGEVLETREGRSHAKVLILQDAHSVPDAQRNIHNLIHQLDKEYGINFIGVEGASGRLDATLFRAFPDESLLRKAFKQYYEAGELTGGSGAALFERGGLPVIGLEDSRLDQECYARYLAASAIRQDAEQILKAVRSRIEAFKKQSYPSALLAIDSLCRRFTKGEPVLAELVRAMAAVEAPNPGTELAILAAKIQNGGGVSLDLATEIRVLSSLVESGIRDKSDLKSSLSRAKQAYQTEHMEPAAYASLLIRTAREAQITIKVSPALEAVLSFQYRFEKIRGSALFKEFEAYRARVYEKLLKDTTAQDARRAAILSEKLDLLEKLAAFELSREEWQKLPESPKAGFSGVLSEEEERGLMQLPVRTFRDFYESAVRREEAIAKNLDRQLKSQDNKGRGTVAVLVLGGFHATGIKAELEKRGISYALLSPRIETLPGEGLYEQHMRGEMSWKAYLKAEHGQVRIYEAFLRAARDRLIDRWQKENPLASRNFILKEWRDNLVRQLAVENRIEETWRYRKFLDEITDTSLLGREGTADRLMRRAGTFVDGIRSLQASGDLNEKAVANLLRSIHFPSPFNAEQLMPGAVTRDPAAGVESKPPAVPKEILLPPLSSKPVRRERPQFRVTEVAPHETRSEARITPSPLLAASTAANKERVQMRNAGIISVVGLAEFITLIAVGASPGIFLTIPVLGLGLGAWLVVTFVLRYPALSRRAEAAAKAYNDSLWPGKATLASQLRHFQGWTLKDQGDAVRGSLGSGHVMACEVSPRGWLITLYPDSRGPEHLKIGWLRPESGGPFALQIFFPAQPGETSERIINIPGYETSNPLMAWEWDAQAGAQTTPGFHYKVEFQESLKGRLPEGFFTSFSSSKGHPGWQLDFTGTAPLSFSSRSRTESRHETDQKSEGSLVPLSYAGKDAGVEELTRLALEKFQESQEETAILIAGDRAIQALNLISNQGVSPGLRVDISPLVPVLKKFEEHAFDKSGALKDLVDLLEKDPVITKDNFKGLSQALEAVNDMNERTELMLRFIRHEFGYDLRNAVHGLLSLSKKGSVFYPALVESLDKFEIFDRVHNRIAERKAQREKGLSVDYPTLPLYEAALWRQYLYYLAGLEHNDEFLAAVEQKSGKKGHFYEMLNLLHEYLIPFTLGELGMYDMDLGKCAAFALESSEIPKEAVTLDLQTAPGAKIFANDVFFHELLAVMMKNSYLVAQERLEAENVERKAAGLSLLTLKDRPIHLTVSAKPEPVGSLALDLIEVADNVGGISDPEMLSEIAPGSERQKITEINTSRRLEDTGFGLAFVWHIVKLHHGTFHIENIQGKAGRGIRASIRIPSKPIADTTVNDDIARSEAREPVRFQLVWGSDFSKQLEDEVGPSGSGAALRFVYKKIKTIESLSLAERFGTPLTSEDLKGLSEFYYTAGQTAYRVVVKYTTHKRVPDRNLRMVGFWDKRRSSDNQVNFNKAMLSARNAPDLDQKNPKEAAEIKRLEDGLYEEVQKPEPGTSDVPPEEGLVRDPRGLLSTLQGVVDHLRNPRLWKNFEVLASTLETMPDEDLVAVENVFLLDASPELRSRRLAGDAEATVGAQILTNWGIIRGELSRIALEGLDPAQDPDATLDALIAVQEFINRYAFNLLHDDMMSELRGLAERLEQPLFRDLIGDMLAMGRSEHRSDSETGEDSAGDWLRRNQKLLLEAIDSPGTDALIRREDILGGIIPMVNDLERRLGLIKSKAPLKEWMNEATAHAILLGVCLNFLSSKGKTQHVQVLDLWLKTLNFSSLGEAARADGEAFKTVILKNPIFQALLKKAASDSEDRPAARSEARTPGSDRGFAGPRSWHIGYFSLRYLPQLLLNVILSGFMAFSSVAQTVMPTPDPIEVYAPDLESKHDGEVASAAEHLATVKDTRAVEALLKALHGTNSVWRIKVLASALKANGSPEALSGMITECGAITGDQSSDKSSRILPLVGAIASFKSPRSEYLFMSLLKAENKWSVDVRAAAAAALASIKTEVALDALIQALGNDDESQVFQDVLIKETSTVGKPAADKLAAKAGDNSVPKESRKIYDRVLEAMGDSRASANKAQATAEKAETPVKKIDEKPPTIDELIKNWKWEALAARGKDAVAPLEKCLDSKNVEVRFGAAWALGRIGDTHSIHPLIKLLADDSKTVQESAVEALVSIGTPAADAWVNWKPGIFGSTPDRGIEVLARLHDSRALDLLKTNASRNHELSDGYFAAQARGLGALGNPDGVKLLKDILKLDKEEARLECIRSLGKLGGSEATDTLVKEYLSHKNVTVRRVTAESLEKMGWTPKTDDEKAQCFIATHDWENLVALRATGRLGASLKDGDYETRIGAGNALLSIASETDSTSPLFWILGAMRRTTTLSSQETALTLEAVNLLGHKAATREDVALLRKVSQEDMKYDKGVRTKAKEALGEARKRLGEETWKRLTSFDGSWIRDFFIWIKPAVKSFGVIYGFCALGLYLIAPVVRALSSLKRIITRRPKKDAGADGRNPPRMKRPFPYFSRLPIALEAVKERDAAGYLVDIFGSPGSVSTGDKAFLFFVAYFVAAAIAGVTCFWVASIWTAVVTFMYLSLAVTFLLPVTRLGIVLLSIILTFFTYVFVLLIYPWVHFRASIGYYASSAISPKHFFVMESIGNLDAAEKLFGALEASILTKFGPAESRRILNKVIDVADEVRKSQQDVRNFIEVQVPVALELSTGLEDFMMNLDIIKKFLSGGQNLQLFQDKKAFRNFFAAASADLKPLTVEQMAVEVGLLEKRLADDGFSVAHFYSEVFGKYDKQILEGSYGVICDLVRNGVYPTAKLIAMSKEKKKPEREHFYGQLRGIQADIRGGAFRSDNPLHAELEYTTFRRIIDTSRIVSAEFGRFSYEDYVKSLKRQNESAAEAKDGLIQAEVLYAAQESLKLKEFLNQVMERSYSGGRPVWVIPNFSLGRFASIFIEGSMWAAGAETVYAKIGSSETHENPYHVDPKFIRSHVLRRMLEEKPVIAVVDSSMHIDRYPDAYQGYLNLAIALNDVIADGDISKYADYVGRDASFIRELKGTRPFQALREIIEKEYATVEKKNDKFFEFGFWNPRGVKLKTRSSWKTRRGTLDKPEPVKPGELDGPAFIFVNSVLLHEDMPEAVLKATRNLRHTPGYFDDIDYMRINHLLFKFDAQGVHLSDKLHEVETRAMELLEPGVQRSKAPDGKPLSGVAPAVAGVVTKEKKLFEERDKMRLQRLLDELRNTDPKVRAGAAADLGEYSKDARVASSLKDAIAANKRNEEVRYWAVISLGAIGDEASVSVLMRVLEDDPAADVRAEAARSLGKLKVTSAIPVLGRVLFKRGLDADVKREILFAFRSIRSKEAMPFLLKTVEVESDPSIRSVAMEAYLDVGRYDAVETALAYMQDPDEKVRFAVFEGIGDLSDELGDKLAFCEEALLKCLMDEPSLSVVEKIVWSLGRIGTERAVAAITAAEARGNGDLAVMAAFAKDNIKRRLDGHNAGGLKIISGGQTGADRGALEGARKAGIPTGGTAPKGYICLLYTSPSPRD